jgi:hypothetical protein
MFPNGTPLLLTDQCASKPTITTKVVYNYRPDVFLTTKKQYAKSTAEAYLNVS